jgi:hypothetical protein
VLLKTFLTPFANIAAFENSGLLGLICYSAPTCAHSGTQVG